MANTEAELSPCPFCGARAEALTMDGWHRVACRGCGTMSGRHSSEQVARRAWNGRCEAPPALAK